jgi:hypothetical protein
MSCHRKPIWAPLLEAFSGDLLHAAREDMQSLSATRQAIGEFSFSSQYQQNPIPLGGNIVKFDWLKFYEPGEEPAKFSTIIQSSLCCAGDFGLTAGVEVHAMYVI